MLVVVIAMVTADQGGRSSIECGSGSVKDVYNFRFLFNSTEAIYE